MNHSTTQIRILHLSDLHFGSHHICNPDDGVALNGVPTLSQLLIDDLNNTDWSDSNDSSLKMLESQTPIIIVISGDFTQQADNSEYKQALRFLEKLTTENVLDKTIPRRLVFMVPGNHDVVFSESDPNLRFQPYVSFYNEFYEKYRSPIFAHRLTDMSQVHVLDDLNLIIAEVNCCSYVEKDTINASRGQVDQSSIAKIRRELSAIDNSKLKNYIKIVFLHHHPILLPSFIENGRGNDSILNSRSFLRLFKEFGFHLLLHGHKHFPQTFSYDPESAWTTSNDSPAQLVISAGSSGSSELPNGNGVCNSYNLITFKWHPAAQQARVRIKTRGLVRTDDIGPLDFDQWTWKNLKTIDRSLTPYPTMPLPGLGSQFVTSGSIENQLEINDTNSNRRKKYDDLRYYIPVIEVMPSLIPGQAYEARVWIVHHGHQQLPPPEEVTWYAGPMFERQVCFFSNNPSFCTSFHYWGPMLIQATLKFEGGYESEHFIYARMPVKYDL